MSKWKNLTKRGLSLFMALVMCVGLLQLSAFAVEKKPDVWDGVTVATGFADGDGKTEETAFQIETGAQLAYLAKLVNGRNNINKNEFFKLTADIDLNNQLWTPIGKGSGGNAFQGRFIGNGHTIKNLNVSNGSASAGLFGYTADAVICDMTIDNATVSGGDAGAFAGTISGNSRLCNLHVRNATVKGSSGVGGIVGQIASASGWTTTVCCSSTDSSGISVSNNFSSTNHAGGIVGEVAGSGGKAYIERCWSGSNSIQTGAGFAGGILGSNCKNTTSTGAETHIIDCYNKASVKSGGPVFGGKSGAGGIAGYLWHSGAEITACYNTGNVTVANSGNAKSPSNGGGITGYGTALTYDHVFNFGQITAPGSTTSASKPNLGSISGYTGGTVNYGFSVNPWTSLATNKYNNKQNGQFGTEAELLEELNIALKDRKSWILSDGQYPTLKRCVPEGADECTCQNDHYYYDSGHQKYDCGCYCAPHEPTVEPKHLTDITKALVTDEAELKAHTPTGVTLSQKNAEGKYVANAEGKVTLLYKITVTGDEGAKFTVSDENSRFVNPTGTSWTGELKSTDATAGTGKVSQTNYVVRTFSVTAAGPVTNTAYLKAGDDTELKPTDPDKEIEEDGDHKGELPVTSDPVDVTPAAAATTVTVMKKFEGLTEAQVTGILNSGFALEYSFDGGTTPAGTLSKDTQGVQATADSLKWTVSVPNGSTLTLKEVKAGLEGYTLTASAAKDFDGITVTFAGETVNKTPASSTGSGSGSTGGSTGGNSSTSGGNSGMVDATEDTSIPRPTVPTDKPGASAPAGTTASAKTVTITNTYVKDAVTYTLIYDAGQGRFDGSARKLTKTASSATGSAEFDVIDQIPTRANYVFLGWAEEDTTDDAVDYKNGVDGRNKVTVSDSDTNRTKTLYAVWTSAKITIEKSIQKKSVDVNGKTVWLSADDERFTDLINGDVVLYTVRVTNIAPADLENLWIRDTMDKKLSLRKDTVQLSNGAGLSVKVYKANDSRGQILDFKAVEDRASFKQGNVIVLKYQAEVINADGQQVENVAQVYADPVVTFTPMGISTMSMILPHEATVGDESGTQTPTMGNVTVEDGEEEPPEFPGGNGGGVGDQDGTKTDSKVTYILTIQYQYADGSKAAEPFTAQFAKDADYSVTSPKIAGYTPDQETVAGTMGAEPRTITVTYTKTEDPAPALQITKIAKKGDTVLSGTDKVNEGDEITYVITVTNTGNVKLTNVEVNDSMEGKVTLKEGDSWTIGELAPTASATITYTYRPTMADVKNGSVVNQVTATAKDPDGKPVTAKDSNGNSVTDQNPLTVTVTTASPKLTVTKIRTNDEWAALTGNPAVTAGGFLYYTITVKNEGEATATGVKLTETGTNLTIVSVVKDGETNPLTAVDGKYDLGDIAKDDSVVLHVTAKAGTAGTAKNKASAEGDNAQPASSQEVSTTVNAQVFTLTYDANAEGVTPPTQQIADAAGEVVLRAQGDMRYPGHTFKGWNTRKDGEGTTYQPGTTLTLTENTTLYAVWEDMVGIEKTASQASVPLNKSVVYTVTLVNNTNTAQTVAFADDLAEDALTVVEGSVKVNSVAQTALPTTIMLLAKGTVVVTYTAKLADTVQVNDTVTNTATVTVDDADFTDTATITAGDPEYNVYIKYVDVAGTQIGEIVTVPIVNGSYDVTTQANTPPTGYDLIVDTQGDTEGSDVQDDVTITVICAKDQLSDSTKDTDGNPDNGDGIPDEYQVQVNYVVTPANSGSVQRENAVLTSETRTILDESGSPALSGTVAINDVTAVAEDTHTFKAWSTKSTGAAVTDGTSALLNGTIEVTQTAVPTTTPQYTFTATFEQKAGTVDITIKYEDEDGNPITDATGSPITKVVTVTKDGPYDVSEEIKNPNGYAVIGLTRGSDSISGTANSDKTVTVMCGVDAYGPTSSTDPTKDGSKGDGIPDRYQPVVNYQVVNGIWTSTNSAENLEYVYSLKVLDAQGKLVDADPVPGFIRPTATANTDQTYDDGAWGSGTPTGGTPVTANMDGRTYTFTFTATITKVTVNWVNGTETVQTAQVPESEITEDGDVIMVNHTYPADPTREGHWAEPVKEDDGSITIAWVDETTYTVTYAWGNHEPSNGDTAPVDPNGYTKGSDVTALEPSVTYEEDDDAEYTFAAWKISTNGVVVGVVYAGEDFTMPGSDVTLTAIWSTRSVDKPGIPKLPDHDLLASLIDVVVECDNRNHEGDTTLQRVGLIEDRYDLVRDANNPYVCRVIIKPELYQDELGDGHDFVRIANQVIKLNFVSADQVNLASQEENHEEDLEIPEVTVPAIPAQDANLEDTILPGNSVSTEGVPVEPSLDLEGNETLEENEENADLEENTDLQESEDTQEPETIEGLEVYNANAPEGSWVLADGADSVTVTVTVHCDAAAPETDYTLRYNANGGNGTLPPSQTVRAPSGSAHMATVGSGNGLTLSGYTFQGWSTSPNSGVVNYRPGNSINLTSDVTLYAVWTQNTPTTPTTPPTGGNTGTGSGGGGGRPGTNPTRPGNTTTIGDTDVPLAGDLQLNKTDHFAYIKGYQDGTVRPNNPITRAQVATIFYRLLDETSRVIYFQETNDFTDVTNDYWANKAISTLTNAGIITGFSDGTFRPNAYITRAQFAAIAARFDNVVPGLNNPFTDVAEDYWARDLIAFAADRGWITGNGGKFRPLENITRVEVMDFINNVLERHVDEQGLLENAAKWSDVPVTDPNYYVVEEATNSHDYTRRTEGQLMENWTQLNPDPVWDE